MPASIDPELLKELQALAAPPRADIVALAQKLAAFAATHPRRMKQALAACKLKPAMGYALTRIGRRLSDLGPDQARLNAIGWGKLDALLAHLTSANSAALLDLAEATNLRDLPRILRGKGPPPGARRIDFDLSRPQRDALTAALIAHGAHLTRRGLKRKEAALMRLIGFAPVPPSSASHERSNRWKTPNS